MKSFVSIIIASYNHSGFITDTINSIYRQDYTNFELIVIDDASTDDSRNIIIELSKKYNFKYLFNNVNLRSPKTYNIGLKIAKGDYIHCFSSDDILMENFLSSSVDFFENNKKYDIIFSPVIIIDENNKEIGELVSNLRQEEMTFKNLVRNNFIFAPSAIFRKDILSDLKGFNEKAVFEDVDFWLRAMLKGYKVGYLDKKLLKYRLHSNNTGRGYIRPLESSFFIASNSREYNLNLFDTLYKTKSFIYRARLINKLSSNISRLLLLIRKNPLLILIFLDIKFWLKITFKIKFPEVIEK